MANPIVQLGSPESFETSCFGDAHQVDWFRFYEVSHHPLRPDQVIEGEIRYCPEPAR